MAMMRSFRTLSVWFAILALLGLAIVPVSAQYDPNVELPRPTNPESAFANQPGYLIVNTDNLFLRTGDSARTNPVAILDGGTRLVVVGINGRTGDSAWWYVRVGGFNGWVKDSFVIVRGDLRGTPIAESDGTLIDPSLYIGVSAPIYDILSPAGKVICNVTGNRFYQVVAQNRAESPTWYRIQATCSAGRVEGWVWAARGLLRNSANLTIPVETE
jgi:hypothetical protein